MQNNPADNPDFLNNLRADLKDPDVKEAIHSQFINGNLSWLLTTPQLKIRDIITSNPESLVLASRRLGKSFVGLATLLEICARSKAICRVFSATKANLQDIINDNMSIFEELAPEGFINRIKSTYRWQVGPHGSEIRLHALEGLQADNTRGGKADFVLIEEASFVTPDQLTYALDSVILPMFLRAQTRIAYITTAAMSDEHWIHSELQPRCEANNSLFLADIYQNPHLSPEKIQEYKDTMRIDAWSREMLCVPYTDPSKVIIPEFKQDIHIQPYELPTHYHLTISIDIGGSRDKTGVSFLVHDYTSKNTYLVDEILIEPNTPTDEIISAVRAQEKQYSPVSTKRVIDCQPQLLSDIRKNNPQWFIQLPNKTLPKKETKEDQLKNAFHRQTLFLSPSCTKTISTIKTGKWNKHHSDWERSEAYGHCDLLASLMYGLRHIDLSNPVPDRYGHNPYTHHTPKSWNKQNKSLHELLDN